MSNLKNEHHHFGLLPTLSQHKFDFGTLVDQANSGKTSLFAPIYQDCSGCGDKICDNSYFSTEDGLWHKRCLTCSVCAANLSDAQSCYSKYGKLYCKRDYYQEFAGSKNRCANCQSAILPTEMVMRAKHNAYHIECFVCAMCEKLFKPGDQIAFHEDKIYCTLHMTHLNSSKQTQMQHNQSAENQDAVQQLTKLDLNHPENDLESSAHNHHKALAKTEPTNERRSLQENNDIGHSFVQQNTPVPPDVSNLITPDQIINNSTTNDPPLSSAAPMINQSPPVMINALPETNPAISTQGAMFQPATPYPTSGGVTMTTNYPSNVVHPAVYSPHSQPPHPPPPNVLATPAAVALPPPPPPGHFHPHPGFDFLKMMPPSGSAPSSKGRPRKKKHIEDQLMAAYTAHGVLDAEAGLASTLFGIDAHHRIHHPHHSHITTFSHGHLITTDTSGRSKRMRTSFKHHQLQAMKQYFNANHNPDAKDLKSLAQKTGLTKRVLQVWFQNARAKFRRNLMREQNQDMNSSLSEKSLDDDLLGDELSRRDLCSMNGSEGGTDSNFGELDESFSDTGDFDDESLMSYSPDSSTESLGGGNGADNVEEEDDIPRE